MLSQAQSYSEDQAGGERCIAGYQQPDDLGETGCETAQKPGLGTVRNGERWRVQILFVT